MKTLLIIGAALAAAAGTGLATAGPLVQPPMNNFQGAFYNCDNGAAFQMSYDSNQPTKATMTTSDDNRQHLLNRTPVSTGVEFSGRRVKFWTDGQTVVVDGTTITFQNCKLKSD
jgi:membrane-bound inhibitor of C-type lysozyme